MTLLDIHDRLGNTSLLFTAVMVLWGLFRYFRRQGVDSSYWGALVIAEVIYLIQNILGVIIYAGGAALPISAFMHILYGVVNLLTLPAIFFFTHGDDKRRTMLVYALGFLFQIGILWRLQATGL